MSRVRTLHGPPNLRNVMNKFRRRFPNYCDFGIQPLVKFDTLEELIDNPLSSLKVFVESEQFSHFELSDNMLMGIDKDATFWAVGWFDDPADPELANLPKWKDPDDKDNKILTLIKRAGKILK